MSLAKGGDDRPIGPGEPQTGALAAHDGELVAEQNDLRVLGGVAHLVHPDELDDVPEQTAEEAESHNQRDSLSE